MLSITQVAEFRGMGRDGVAQPGQSRYWQCSSLAGLTKRRVCRDTAGQERYNSLAPMYYRCARTSSCPSIRPSDVREECTQVGFTKAFKSAGWP